MQSKSPGNIPLCEPFLGGNESEYVQECIRTGWVSSVGSFVDRFESSFAARHPGTGAVAVASGTAALHLALLAVGVEPDDEVLVSTMTFIAPANAIRYVGAWPVPIDADPEHWQMNLQCVTEFIETGCVKRGGHLFNKRTGRRVSAILPVHILGHPVDMDALMEIADRHKLKVVEDATESLGAFVRGRPVGVIGHAGCFSFNGNKLMTTGGGGMVISSDGKICQRVRYLSTQAKNPGIEYIHSAVGFNYRLTNIQAALGCAQLEQLDRFVEKKREIATAYKRGLGQIPGIKLQIEAEWAISAWWLFTVLVDPIHFGHTARELIEKLAAEGVNSRPLWQPVHQSPAHLQDHPQKCSVADTLFERGVSLPSSVGICETDLDRVTMAIHTSMRRDQT